MCLTSLIPVTVSNLTSKGINSLFIEVLVTQSAELILIGPKPAVPEPFEIEKPKIKS